jgi:hypothetical protein
MQYFDLYCIFEKYFVVLRMWNVRREHEKADEMGRKLRVAPYCYLYNLTKSLIS